jgi:hypothetical protein
MQPMAFLFRRRVSGPPPASPPNAPTNISASVQSSTSVLVAWQDNSTNEIGFELFRAVADGAAELLQVLSANVTSYLDTGLTAGVQYSYSVRAYNSVGGSGVAGPVSVTPNAGALAAPTDLTAVAQSGTSILLEWTDNTSTEDGFRVYRKIGDASYAPITTVSAGITQFLNEGLTVGESYCYRVTAFEGSIESGESNEACVANLGRPSVPTDLIAVGQTLTTIDLEWEYTTASGDGDPDGFVVYRDSEEYATVASDLARAYTATGLTEGVSYTWTVRAYNDAGESADSNTLQAGTRTAAPSNLVGTQLGEGEFAFVRFTWTNNSVNASGLTLQYLDGMTWLDFDTFAITTQYDLEIAQANTSFRLIAVASGGATDSEPSNVVAPPWPVG